tara:strand:- start:142 stop:753 length:612 start_codon:yes stop_codon:yes gene_type:complete
MKRVGWRLTALVTVLILAGLALHFGVSGWTAASVTAGIDATGRSSLALFSIAFVASSVQRLWPSSLTQWMLQNRRWIGLSFASSHAIHLALIIAMSIDFPDPFLSQQPAGKWLLGGVGYLFVALMAMTSTNAAQRWMGMKNWKRLHLVGSYWLWAQFALTYVSHVKKGPANFYLPFLGFTLALLVIRWIGHLRPKSPLSPVGG